MAGMSRGEVAATAASRSSGDVGVDGVDAGVDDADVTRLPVAFLCAPSGVAPIISMSHCRSASGSAAGRGPAGPVAGPARPRPRSAARPLLGEAVRHARAGGADRVVAGRAADAVLGPDLVEEGAVGGGDQGETDCAVTSSRCRPPPRIAASRRLGAPLKETTYSAETASSAARVAVADAATTAVVATEIRAPAERRGCRDRRDHMARPFQECPDPGAGGPVSASHCLVQ